MTNIPLDDLDINSKLATANLSHHVYDYELHKSIHFNSINVYSILLLEKKTIVRIKQYIEI